MNHQELSMVVPYKVDYESTMRGATSLEWRLNHHDLPSASEIRSARFRSNVHLILTERA